MHGSWDDIKVGEPSSFSNLDGMLRRKTGETRLAYQSEDKLSPTTKEIYQKAKVLDSREVWHILRKKSQLKLARFDTSNEAQAQLKVYTEHMLSKKLLEIEGQCRHLRRYTRVVLMYKASKANADRTALLLANSHIQHPTEAMGGDSPAKYLSCGIYVKKDPISWHQHTLPSLKYPVQRPTRSLKDTSGLGSRSPLGPPHGLSGWFFCARTRCVLQHSC